LLNPADAPLKQLSVGEKGNVLIVEDDEDLASMLIVVLGMEGYGVRAVMNREQAIVALEKNIYQIVLLDLMMPGMSAQDFVTRAQRRYPLCTIILMTAGDVARQKAHELAVGYCLQKPFEPEHLLEMLDALGV
jgi:two-component system, OmpR family, response regulator